MVKSWTRKLCWSGWWILRCVIWRWFYQYDEKPALIHRRWVVNEINLPDEVGLVTGVLGGLPITVFAWGGCFEDIPIFELYAGVCIDCCCRTGWAAIFDCNGLKAEPCPGMGGLVHCETDGTIFAAESVEYPGLSGGGSPTKLFPASETLDGPEAGPFIGAWGGAKLGRTNPVLENSCCWWWPGGGGGGCEAISTNKTDN